MFGKIALGLMLILMSVSILGTGIPAIVAEPLEPLVWGSYTRLSYTSTETRWAIVAANEKYDPNYIVVVFTDNLTGQYDWYFTESDDAGVTWTSPEIAVDPDFDVMESELYMAAMAMDDNGMVHLSFARQKTWWPRDTTPTGIYYARYDGTSWSAPIVIYENLSPDYLVVGPTDITPGMDNTVHLAYGSDYPGNDNGDVWYCRSEDNGLTWTSPINVNAFDYMDVGYPPSLAADDSGYVYWANGDDWYSYGWWSELYFRASPNNGVTWNSQMAIARREDGDRFPRLMCDNSGGVYVVWIGSPPDSLFFKYSTDHGSNWNPYSSGIALTDSVPGIGDGYFAELDDSGFIHIIYQSTATGTAETYYMRIDTNGNIVDPPQIITPEDGYASIPTGLALAGDQACVATKDLKDGNWEAYFLTRGAAIPPYGPTAKFTATPETADVDESVTFDGSSSELGWNGTDEIPIAEYRWNFGDGNETTTFAPIVYHSFTSSGNYYVELTVYAPGATPETNATIHEVTVVSVPVGGHSIPMNRPATAMPLTSYLLIAAGLACILIKSRRRKR